MKLHLLLLLFVVKSFAQGNEIIRIPVIFHIVYANGDENIDTSKLLDELNDLNLDFKRENPDTIKVETQYKYLIGNANIEFYLADTLLPNAKERGIIRTPKKRLTNRLYKSSKVIHPDRYMNVYVGGVYNSITKLTGLVYTNEVWKFPYMDAIFLDWSVVGKHVRALTHETGHWLGLYHTYQKNDNCTSDNDDGISDTPLQNYASGFNTDKTKCFTLEPSENNCGTSLPAMYNNFMDYSNCRYMFTLEQVNFMRKTIASHRAKLLVKQ